MIGQKYKGTFIIIFYVERHYEKKCLPSILQGYTKVISCFFLVKLYICKNVFLNTLFNAFFNSLQKSNEYLDLKMISLENILTLIL